MSLSGSGWLDAVAFEASSFSSFIRYVEVAGYFETLMPLPVGIGMGDIGPPDIVGAGDGEGYGCAAPIAARLEANMPTASASPRESVSMRVFIGVVFPAARILTHA
jgi:hypothetical protein